MTKQIQTESPWWNATDSLKGNIEMFLDTRTFHENIANDLDWDKGNLAHPLPLVNTQITLDLIRFYLLILVHTLGKTLEFRE